MSIDSSVNRLVQVLAPGTAALERIYADLDRTEKDMYLLHRHLMAASPGEEPPLCFRLGPS